MEELKQPHAGTEGAEQAGAETPHPDEQPEPGAEKEPQALPGAEEQPGAGPHADEDKPKYSEKAWIERETVRDGEVAAARSIASQAAMQVQIAQQQQIETDARAKDKTDVDEGTITQAEAQQRQQGRQVSLQRALQAQQGALQAQQKEIATRPQRERGARAAVAERFAEHYGVSIDDLVKDKAITTPEQMEAKAKQLAKATSDDEVGELKARIKVLEEGEPFFDRGQTGTGGPAIDNMSAEEKIKYGLTHPVKKK